MPGLGGLRLLHIDLAGDGRSDEGGEMLLQELNCLLRLGDEGIEISGLAVYAEPNGQSYYRN